ncbi:hypothetical protein BDQ12DRAFT_685503 [Crucibulum laeve]|uniref:Secreted protein n=1 Tax=Crucibulum laeve TaxID=68775 RepID=A0A5C3LWM3_9AGAR|nr:hypothetical protein BDQ12DRAFT_685503 [Crucibulum laeve]
MLLTPLLFFPLSFLVVIFSLSIQPPPQCSCCISTSSPSSFTSCFSNSTLLYSLSPLSSFEQPLTTSSLRLARACSKGSQWLPPHGRRD